MKAKLLTVAVMGVALFVGWKSKRRVVAPEEPRAVIYEMFNACRARDVPRYLATYADPMAGSLKRTVSAQYLRDFSEPVTGVALSDVQRASDTAASVQVQVIYRDRTESQTYFLVHSGSGWKIARTEDAQRTAALVPYGTPVRLTRRANGSGPEQGR